MRRVTAWATRTVGWVSAAALAYVGFTFVAFSGMIGPRGSIDYPDFTAARKRAADLDAVGNQLFGFLLLLAAVAVVLFANRLYRRISPGASASHKG